MKLKKKELIIFLLILAAAVVSMLLLRKHKDTRDYGSIKITVEGVEFGTYSLGEDQKIRINGTNTCRIRDGQAQMIEANCPDHLCLHQSAIDERGGMIICLPNQVIIEGIPSQEAQSDPLALDGIAQ